MAFEANAILARNATSAWQRSNSTVRRSTALICENSLVFLVLSSQDAGASAGYETAAYGASVTGAAVTGAADGADVAAALQAAKMIADAAARTARRDHHLVEWDMLASPPTAQQVRTRVTDSCAGDSVRRRARRPRVPGSLAPQLRRVT